jgi:hypothetical protein
MPKFEQTRFSIDGRRFSDIWFSESVRNWRVIVLLYESVGTDFRCEVVNNSREIRSDQICVRYLMQIWSDICFSLRGCWYKSGCEVVNNSIIWSDIWSDLPCLLYQDLLSGFCFRRHYSHKYWVTLCKKTREFWSFYTKSSSVARDSTKLRHSSVYVRNVQLKSGMCSSSCVMHLGDTRVVPHSVTPYK